MQHLTVIFWGFRVCACWSLWRWHLLGAQVMLPTVPFFLDLGGSWSLGTTRAFYLSERKVQFGKGKWFLHPGAHERQSGTWLVFVVSHPTACLPIMPSSFLSPSAGCVHGCTCWDEEGCWVWAAPPWNLPVLLLLDTAVSHGSSSMPSSQAFLLLPGFEPVCYLHYFFIIHII